MARRALGIDVLTAARQRIATTFDLFPRVCLSFSGGKDSSVLLHLTMEEAVRRGRKVGLLFIDLEGQYALTIEHVAEMFRRYRDHIDPYWVALPLHLRNAVSMHQPYWVCWDPDARNAWIRTPPEIAITDPGRWPWFRHAMEFEEFVDEFARWYSGGEMLASLVAIRTQESLNRWRALASTARQRLEGHAWTTWKGGQVFNCYPIYDWSTEDVWRAVARFGWPYNRLYDLMWQAGIGIHDQRICQPYGDDQRKGLHLFHVIEPETWSRLLDRVMGANTGALYAHQTGDMMGRISVSLPAGHTWESYARLLLDSLPPAARSNYVDKIETFIQWWAERGYAEGIPDEADPELEAQRRVPSWRRIARVILRNDFLCKGLSFSQQVSGAHDKFQRVMAARRRKWGARVTF